MLTAIRSNCRSDHRPKSRTLQMALLLFVIVLMLLAMVHVADGHSVASSADGCRLCIVMHSVAPFVIMAVVMALVRIGDALTRPA